jgi:hypothetical protein
LAFRGWSIAGAKRSVAPQNRAQVVRTRTALAAAIKDAPDWQEF